MIYYMCKLKYIRKIASTGEKKMAVYSCNILTSYRSGTISFDCEKFMMYIANPEITTKNIKQRNITNKPLVEIKLTTKK